MKVISLAIEPGRASQASAEFTIQVALDGPAAECAVLGRVVGPRAEAITTVEVAYPLVPIEVRDSTVTLKCVIPEPGLWSEKAPFVYAWSVEVQSNGKQTDARSGAMILRGPDPR
jgi:hypothetical protein